MKRSRIFVIISIVILLAFGALYIAFQKKQTEDRGETFSYRAFFGLGERVPTVIPGTETPGERPGTETPGTTPETPGGQPVLTSRFTNSAFNPSPSTLPNPTYTGGTRTGSNLGLDIDYGDGTIFPTDPDNINPDDDTIPDPDTDGAGRNACVPGQIPEIKFSAEELEKLQVLLSRFYRLAPSLYSDANVQLEEQNRIYFQGIIKTSNDLALQIEKQKASSSYTGLRTSKNTPYYTWNEAKSLTPVAVGSGGATSGSTGVTVSGSGSGLGFFSYNPAPSDSYILPGSTGVNATEQELKDFENQFGIW